MAAAKIVSVDFNKMTSKWRHYRPAACGHVRWGRSASQSTASNASVVLIGRKNAREYVIYVYRPINASPIGLIQGESKKYPPPKKTSFNNILAC